MNEKIVNMVNDKIIKQLEEGHIPWRKYWTEGIPQNFISKRSYSGINLLMLSADHFPTPYYLTFLQCKEKDGKILAGSKGSQIVFWKILDYPDLLNPEKTNSFPFLRYSTVFNLSQTSLFKPDEKLNRTIITADKIIENMQEKPIIKNNYQSCFYSRNKKTGDDYICIPLPERFDSVEEYHAALFHELIHWTGSPKRLNRFETFEDAHIDYSFEELVAEIGSAYLFSLADIGNKSIQNSAAYIQGWLKHLKNDRTFVLKASSQAQKAVDFITGANVSLTKNEAA